MRVGVALAAVVVVMLLLLKDEEEEAGLLKSSDGEANCTFSMLLRIRSLLSTSFCSISR